MIIEVCDVKKKQSIEQNSLKRKKLVILLTPETSNADDDDDSVKSKPIIINKYISGKAGCVHDYSAIAVQLTCKIRERREHQRR